MLVQAAVEESTRVRTRQRPISGAGYYPWFDWLRLLLACVVLFGHEGPIGWRNAGNFAVQVFFALSGWLIGGQLVVLPGESCRGFILIALCGYGGRTS